MLDPNRVIAKDDKSWPQEGATHYQAKLGHPDKARAIKVLVVCYVVCLGSMINDMGLLTSARCAVLYFIVVRMVLVLKFSNTP